VLVATVAGVPVGYGVAHRMALPGLPDGWYLGGVVVTPTHRRQGIAARLTRARLDWIAARAERAYYFTNERNRASVDLHARFGFRSRGGQVPGHVHRQASCCSEAYATNPGVREEASLQDSSGQRGRACGAPGAASGGGGLLVRRDRRSLVDGASGR
jgi:GNAT superfamily N-acetyltransferase